MTRTAILLCTALCLLSSCKYMKSGPYKGYRITDDEAIPASKVGGAPYKKQI
ncbi:MAG: hypothetical protein J6R92_06675 [Akkermansia sp.]|nr:hypothetical protein [Akkermansia sp.]